MEPDDGTSLRVASFAYYLDNAKDNLFQRVSSQEPPIAPNSIKPKSSTTKPLLNNTFSHPKDTKESHENLRVDSFSYLNNAAENFVFKVPGPIQDPTTSFTFSREFPKDKEIGVFGADKYFNMKLEYQGVKPEFKNKVSANITRPNIRPTTTSLLSDESSWNSQTALLPNIPSQTKHKKAFGKRIFSGFGCQGPCFDKKDVHVNKIVEKGAPNASNLSLIPNQSLDYFQESRNSIEVFGSRRSLKGDIVTNLERKLSMLTWDAIPKGQKFPTSSSTICDDMASDASSDLFEIENISGSIYPILSEELSRDDQMSSCMASPISNYAPSETSIQWSVVTASAADFSSIISDNEERDLGFKKNVISRSSRIEIGVGKDVQKISRAGGILGCNSHKALDVAENMFSHGGNQDFQLRRVRKV